MCRYLKPCLMEGVIDMAYELVSCWLPEWKYDLKASFYMKPVGIAVHNTAGSASAKEEANNMINNNSPVSYNVVIDEQYAVECIPFNRNTWHAGDGTNGFANRNLISIEIARSMDYSSDKYDRAESNAVEYIAQVCVQFGWNSENLHQHNWYSATACPHRLKDHWDKFCRRVDKRIAELNEDVPDQPTAPDKPTETKDTITVFLHGWEREIKGVNKDGAIYVGIRDLLSQMGYDVSWNDGKVVVNYK